MRILSTCTIVIAAIALICLVGPPTALSQITIGEPAPDLTLQDSSGSDHMLADLKPQDLIVLYFFDTQSQASLDGLAHLDLLIQKHQDSNLVVWGITRSDPAQTRKFIDAHAPKFPVLQDDQNVSQRYDAQFILPTVCIIGPELKVLEHIQGGGETTEQMLTALAEKALQRNDTMLAKSISQEVQKQKPNALKAKTIFGYAALREGNLDEAEAAFKDLSRSKGRGEVLSQEGLAVVYAKKGQPQKALAAAETVEKMAPDRAYAHVIKGDILASQNKTAEAKAEYETAVAKPEAEPFQKALAYNKLGRLQSDQGNLQQAKQLYAQAVEIDPYLVEAMSNKGVVHEKEGNLDQALAEYQKALSINQNDTFSAVLAQKAQEMLELSKDKARSERVDKLVKDLAERYRKQNKFKLFKDDTDEWTSRPMVLTFLDFSEKGTLTEREGTATVMATQLSQLLNDSGRVQVVERVVMDLLLEELNIGSSQLADPETALKLGQVLAAKLIGTGALLNQPDGTLLNLRLIDTETTQIPKVITRQIPITGAALEKELHRLNREVIETVMQKYPLQGYLVQVSGDRVILNLGSQQGVVLGSQFAVIEESKPIEYKGKKLKGLPKQVARLEIEQVEPDLSYARILDQQRPPKKDDKVLEQASQDKL